MKKSTKALLAIGGVAATTVGLHLLNKELHKDVCMIAHRGHSSKHPGNTEAAFLSAVKNGSGGIETDVRITKDGVFVVNHNDEAKFFDGTELIVADSTFEELSQKALYNDKSDEIVYICTFERYLEICRDANMCLRAYSNRRYIRRVCRCSSAEERIRHNMMSKGS